MLESQDLPVIAVEVAERCDAARNRRRILAAASELFARGGVAHVSLDKVAAAAGVGKGTIFRRFGDRAGLLRALLSDHEAALQERLIRGPAPLGPGAPPRERLLAFGPALLVHVQGQGDLLAAADKSSSHSRVAHPTYAFYRLHLMTLLEQIDPGLDAEYAADALLAPLGADLCLYQLRMLEMSPERLADGWRALAGRLVPADSSRSTTA